jgi:membrane fusion protein (multidrug efflux system)
MSKKGWAILISGVLTGMMVGSYWFFFDRPGRTKPASPVPEARAVHDPVASVEVAKIKKATITQNITVYGSVIPSRRAIQTISVPFESQVRRLMVINGQKISPGDILLEINSSPDSLLQLEQARSAFESARQSLQNVQHRFDLKIATEQQVLQTQEAFRQARLRLESMEKRGIGEPRLIRADLEGLVNKVYAQEGTIFPAGGPLVEIVGKNQLEVRLGVEPENIKQIYVGQPVSLTPIKEDTLTPVIGRIGEVSQTVNPATRLVDVLVTFPSPAGFLPGEWILCRIAVASANGLLIPRSAPLPANGHYTLFTVRDGRAQKHIVQIAVQGEKEVQVISKDLRPGDLVVVLGNYELKDGMKVKVQVSP